MTQSQKTPTMNDSLAQKLKYLRLGALHEHWDDYLQQAAARRFSHGRLLTHVIDQEYQMRRENARQFRLKRAGIPEPWVMETYPFDKQPRLDKKKLMALYDSQAYLQKHQNILWLGVTGCGKTGLATSFLTQAINQGYNGRYVLFAELVGELYRSVADHSESSVLKKYLSCDLLFIDEIGYAEVEPVQVGLFFTLMQKRHQKKSTLITSNLGFSEWGSFLNNDHLTAALIDRLTANSHIIHMKKCHSLREPVDPDPHELGSQPKAD